ncbi:MAG: heme o synthase [Candidatus Limnocylindrales bacterium]
MTRFQKLALLTAIATYVLVVWGGVVRVTGSGLGCPDWPLCYGQVLPPFDDGNAWIEWIHRTLAAVVGLLVFGVWVGALLYHRRRAIVLPATAAVVLTGFQAYLGKITVETGNSGESVTAHLAMAMIVLAALIHIAVRVHYPAVLPPRGAPQRFTLLAVFAAMSTYALMLFGSQVTATASALIFGTAWPLFPDGAIVPVFDANPDVASLQAANALHRIAAAIVGLIVFVTAWIAWRRAGDGRWGAVAAQATILALTGTAAALYAVQVIVGALQIWTTLAPWAVALHLALGAAIWSLLVAAVTYSYCEARTAVEASGATRATESPTPKGTIDQGSGDGDAGGAGTDADRPAPGAMDKLRAYVALTKPRIIELLLVTTVPAMVLAQRGIPPLGLMVATLVGGSLAAGSANAINQYLDRDIDLLMTRTRRRPLPAHAIEPEDALVFGLALGVVAFAELALFTNLLAAFLTLLAIAFYVVVYTIWMKRTTSQNIVIGGLAGALPPLIGWAAVTGDIALPGLFLVAIVFYWTPPHFWALSMRLAKDYRAAGVPMLPVVRGIPETTKQIALYSFSMFALTLTLFAVAQLGLIYLVGTVAIGAVFLAQALRMWRDGTDARAVRLYKYSTTYLTVLFALIVVDVLVPLPV